MARSYPSRFDHWVVVLVVVCLLLSASVAMIPVTAQPDSEEEPNDSQESATSIEPGSVVNGDISSEGDVDWYAFEVEAGETINVTATAGDQGETEFELENADDHIAHMTVSGGTNIIGTTAHRTGTYYVRVSPGSGESRGDEYTLQVETYDTDDFEPDTQESAVELAPNATQTAFMSIGDVDWYAFDAEAGETINVTATARDRGETEFELETADDHIAHMTVSGGTNSIGTTAQRTGTYYVRVSPGSGEKRGDEYTFQVETYETDDFEPDTQDSPVEVTPNVTRSGIISIGDVDWYAFDAEAGETINVTATAGDRGETLFELETADGTIARMELDGGTNNIGTTAHRTGTYYVRVSPGSGEKRGDEYDLQIDTYRSDDFEPDTQDTAMELVPNATQSGVISIGDVDWFVFEAVDGAVYNVSLTAGERGETGFEVVGPGGSMKRAFVEGGTKSRVITANGSTAHYVLVEPGSGHKRGDEYTLEITTNATTSPEETGDSSTGEGSGDGDDEDGSSGAVSQEVIGIGLLLVAAIVLIVVFLRRRNRD